MNIFKELDYRKIIRSSLKNGSITAREVAEKSGMHGSYFSRVMKGDAEFSAEQLFAMTRLFGYSAEQAEYILLLGERARSGSTSHQQYLKKRIDEIRTRKLKLKEELADAVEVGTTSPDYATYYLEAMTARVHMYLCLEEYRLQPSRICDRLGIPAEKLKEEIQKLESIGLIKSEGSQIRVLKDSIHLDESDRFSPVNHANWRLEAVQRLARRRQRPQDYHCTVNFTTNEEGQAALKDAFKEFLVKAQKIVGNAGRETRVCTLNFDLFED